MKKIVFLIAAVFWGMPLFSAAYRIENISFYPERIFIGDEVSCRLIIGKEASAVCLPSETLPQTNNVTVRSVTVRDDGERAQIDIQFAPYVIGFFYLPSIHCGEFEISGIRVTVFSLLEKGGSPSLDSPLPVFRLRRLYAVFAAVFALLMAVPVVAAAFFPEIKRRAQRFFSKLFRRNPYRTFSSACRNLEKSVDVMDSRQLYNEMIHIFRRYLTLRTGENFFIVMTREIKDRLAVYLDQPQACAQAAEIMEHSDAVRFGSRTEGISRERKDLSQLQKIAAQIEDSITGRKK